MPTFHYEYVLLITYNPGNISTKYRLGSACTICTSHGHEYFAEFARLRFYPTSSLCSKWSVIAWFNSRAWLFII